MLSLEVLLICFVIPPLADCCEARGGALQLWKWSRLKCASLSVHAYNFLHILQVLPILLSIQILLSLHFLLWPEGTRYLECASDWVSSHHGPSYTTSWMPQAGMPQAASRAGPGPQRGGLIGDRQEGPCEGGRPRGWPRLSRVPARTPPISEEPLRGAGRWGNRLLVVADNDEVAVTGQTRAPSKEGVGQNRADREWPVCVWVTWTT